MALAKLTGYVEGVDATLMYEAKGQADIVLRLIRICDDRFVQFGLPATYYQIVWVDGNGEQEVVESWDTVREAQLSFARYLGYAREGGEA